MNSRDAQTPNRIMTTAEVAKYLKVHPSTIYKLIGKGQIPVFKIGSDHRFDRIEIDKWMTARQVTP